MRIFAIGRNYAAHAKELDNECPDEPIIFTKPDAALLTNNRPFYYPSFSNDVHYEAELVIKISKEGKHIKENQTHQHYDSIGIGIDFTARDWQQKAKSKGLPWDIAKGFDCSAPISDTFLSLKDIKDVNNISFHLEVDGMVRQQGNTSMLLFTFDEIIAYLSKFFTIKVGDLIFTGTPKGVGPVNKGNRLTGYIENSKLIDFEVK